jgi:phosphoesterase RecJ-like protein
MLIARINNLQNYNIPKNKTINPPEQKGTLALNFLSSDKINIISKPTISFKSKFKTEKAKDVWNTIIKNDTIIILPHKRPDGDAISSALALLSAIKEKFPRKNVTVLSEDISSSFNNTPGIDSVQKKLDPVGKYLTIIVDGSERQLSDENKKIYDSATSKIIIDHHAEGNPKNGVTTLIDETALSTTAILYRLFKTLKLSISKNTAKCLLTGLTTDTGNFTHKEAKGQEAMALKQQMEKLSQMTTRAISDELNTNNKPSKEIINLRTHLIENKTKTIQNRNVNGNKNLNIKYILITLDDLKNFQVKESFPDIKQNCINYILSRLQYDSDIRVVLFEEKKGSLKASLRSNKYDVQKFATKYQDGGGHISAAGFNAPLDQTNEVLNNLENYRFIPQNIK